MENQNNNKKEKQKRKSIRETKKTEKGGKVEYKKEINSKRSSPTSV